MARGALEVSVAAWRGVRETGTDAATLQRLTLDPLLTQAISQESSRQNIKAEGRGTSGKIPTMLWL